MLVMAQGQGIDIGVDQASPALVYSIQEFECKKVTLEIRKIKRPSDFYKAYSIPESENLIAFCKEKIPLFGITCGGIVFTDKAMYIYPKERVKQTRFAYVDFSKYLIVKQYMPYLEKTAGLYMQNDLENHLIYDQTFVFKNTASDELYKVLTAIQNDLTNKNMSAMQEMIHTTASILKEYKMKMRGGYIIPQHEMLLKNLLNNEMFCEDAFMLLAENNYRDFHFDNYNAFLEKMASSVSNEMIEKAVETKGDFLNRLIDDLSNLRNEMKEDYIKRLYKKINPKYCESFPKHVGLTLKALSAARLLDFTECADCIDELRKSKNGNYAQIPENYMMLTGNHLMAQMLKNIQSENITDEMQLNIRDGLGLTPLHYAIIFADEKNISRLLNQREWSGDFKNVTFDESRFVYKYSVAYYIRFEKINPEILNETEFELKEIREVLSKLREQADNFFDVMHNLNESLYYARRDLNKLNEKYYNGEYCYKEVSQFRESISDMENKLTVAEQRFREIKKKTEEYEALYSKKYEFIEKAVVEKSKHVLSDNMPIYYFFKSIYQNAPKGINISKIYMRCVFMNGKHNLIISPYVRRNLTGDLIRLFRVIQFVWLKCNHIMPKLYSICLSEDFRNKFHAFGRAFRCYTYTANIAMNGFMRIENVRY